MQDIKKLQKSINQLKKIKKIFLSIHKGIGSRFYYLKGYKSDYSDKKKKIKI